MEDVLEVYHRPDDRQRPVVCIDETSKQLVAETRAPLPAVAGRVKRYDFEYQRNGVANVFMIVEPLAGWRTAKVTERRTKQDWAAVMRAVVEEQYPEAERVVVVMDNLNTHALGSLYETYPPEQARRIAEKLEIHYTPKHGSWLNVAEIELSVLSGQCLDRRIGTMHELTREVAAWEADRNRAHGRVVWQFTAADARIKLHRLYPSIEA